MHGGLPEAVVGVRGVERHVGVLPLLQAVVERAALVPGERVLRLEVVASR